MTTHTDSHGVARQDHYGAGRQPWDDIVDLGWAPAFAAGNVLKYLRRDKRPEHSLESARWYWRRLQEFRRDARYLYRGAASVAVVKLSELLTAEELAKLEAE